MLSIAGIIVVAGMIALFEVPAIWRQGLKKELGIFVTFLLAGAGLSIALVLRVKLPNPLEWMETVYKPLSDLLMSILK